MKIMRCVLSGSFRRDTQGLVRDYQELAMAGCQILSPHRLAFIDPAAAFVKDEAEAELSPSEIEQHHLLALKQSDFVWLHCPEGYLGPSAAFEIGYARSLGKPVYAKAAPTEPGLADFVTVVPSVFMALMQLQS
jgi:nucleoside 2-deoxyribosyltransferase